MLHLFGKICTIYAKRTRFPSPPNSDMQFANVSYLHAHTFFACADIHTYTDDIWMHKGLQHLTDRLEKRGL